MTGSPTGRRRRAVLRFAAAVLAAGVVLAVLVGLAYGLPSYWRAHLDAHGG